ncbi:MAG: Lon protease family protein, partial [Dehalococcoidia bacterium]
KAAAFAAWAHAGQIRKDGRTPYFSHPVRVALTVALKFGCTDEIAPLQALIGQDRAIQAIDFGLALEKKGYNIFVTGLTGTGKASAIKAHLERVVAQKKDVGDHAMDWCYIHNFADQDRPKVLSLPKGKGRALRDSLDRLHQDLKSAVAQAFSGEEYERQRKSMVEQGQQRRNEVLSRLEQEVNRQGFTAQSSPAGLMLIPLIDGKPISQQDYAALPEEVRKEMDAKQRELTKLVNERLEQIQALDKEIGQELKSLDEKIGDYALRQPFNDLKEEYKDFPDILKFLDEIKDYTLKHIDLFREREAQAPISQVPTVSAPVRERDPYLPFRVNVLVDNRDTVGPPIVIEPHPTYANLFGKIERRPVMGAYTTDHTMLKPGAVNEANGGYLVVDVRELLMNQGAWEGLKRVIKTNEARLEDPFEQLGFLAPHGLRPEPIPTNVKVLVTGDHMLYQLLSQYDEDFWELFKVKADFDYQIDRNDENLEAYAAFICRCCQTENLLAFDRTAVAKVAEYGARLVADQGKLSTRFGLIQEVCIEASYWAEQDGSQRVYDTHVDKAIEEKVYRSNLIDEKIRDLITEGTLMVDVDGEAMGQVNGLAVYDLGNISFGKPSRITAKTFLGRDGVINIEREAQLSGRTHDKGVLILSGYLGSKYAKDKPLSLNASLAFEQNYEGVDGDSASSTELYAILSSLSSLPINQSIAVTGSVNQQGEIQAIGGVNQKIEGFFEVCKAKGLTGEQGVIIPHQNVKNLMLREEVVKAAEEGSFHIYAVKTIDEGIEILTGVPAGETQEDNTYPKGTVNHLVDERLREQAKSMKGYAERPA